MQCHLESFFEIKYFLDRFLCFFCALWYFCRVSFWMNKKWKIVLFCNVVLDICCLNVCFKNVTLGGRGGMCRWRRGLHRDGYIRRRNASGCCLCGGVRPDRGAPSIAPPRRRQRPRRAIFAVWLSAFPAVRAHRNTARLCP